MPQTQWFQNKATPHRPRNQQRPGVLLRRGGRGTTRRTSCSRPASRRCAQRNPASISIRPPPKAPANEVDSDYCGRESGYTRMHVAWIGSRLLSRKRRLRETICMTEQSAAAFCSQIRRVFTRSSPSRVAVEQENPPRMHFQG